MVRGGEGARMRGKRTPLSWRAPHTVLATRYFFAVFFFPELFAVFFGLFFFAAFLGVHVIENLLYSGYR